MYHNQATCFFFSNNLLYWEESETPSDSTVRPSPAAFKPPDELAVGYSLQTILAN
jgi:hypothetical protein